MFVIFPVWQVTRYLLSSRLASVVSDGLPGDRDIGTFVMRILHSCSDYNPPLVFVAIKWIVIAAIQTRSLPTSSYYLRWWFVDICRKIFLPGGSVGTLLNFYYSLLEPRFPKELEPEADAAEYDLVTVGRNAAIEYATLRGFVLTTES
jgi:hypothetical protein